MTDTLTRHTLEAVALDEVSAAAHPLTGAATDYAPLLDLVGDAQVVLIGEASHGTQEFYEQRAAITRRLIAEKGFGAVLVEADWPDAYRINCYVRGASDDRDAEAALGDFQRFPAWMWRNTVVRDFVAWLRAYNDKRDGQAPDRCKTGFYGMDLYSLHTSLNEVLRYLDATDSQAARRARARYACLEQFAEDPQAYGLHTLLDPDESCCEGALDQLLEMQRHHAAVAIADERIDEDQRFYAEQNARLVKNAEAYYRALYNGRTSSWNLRDTHMAETLDALIAHLDGKRGQRTRVVVWAHNSHLGDARATQMGEGGELNVGQLVRARYGSNAVLIGFSTYHGTVTAASDWDGPAERKIVLPALLGSYEAFFHETGLPCFLLPLREGLAAGTLPPRRLERAIGVIYRPQTERQSHYFFARLAAQFDAIIHLDETQALQALEPLASEPVKEGIDLPETYPSNL